MHLRIVLVILVICASSQINAERIDEREVIERIYQIGEDMFHILERMRNSFPVYLTKKDSSGFHKYDYTEFNISRREIFEEITMIWGKCKTKLQPATTPYFPQESTLHTSSNTTRNPTPPTTTSEFGDSTLPTTATTKHNDIIQKELWNQIISQTTFLKNPIGKLKQLGEKLVFEILRRTLLKSFFDHLKELGNRLWYGILLMNLLKIKCYSEDQTLKEMWHQIPEPLTTPEFGNFTLKELWDNQDLPPLSLDNLGRPTAIPESEAETMEDVWNKVNYQLLFLHIMKIKYQPHQPAPFEQLNEFIPTHIIKHRDIAVTELWNDLTRPNIIPDSGDNASKELMHKLYFPILCETGVKFKDPICFGNYSLPKVLDFNPYQKDKFIPNYIRNLDPFESEQLMENYYYA